MLLCVGGQFSVSGGRSRQVASVSVGGSDVDALCVVALVDFGGSLVSDGLSGLQFGLFDGLEYVGWRFPVVVGGVMGGSGGDLVDGGV